MNPLRYASIHGKFSQALGDMAESTAPLTKRLEQVFVSHLLPLLAKEFPKELQDRFRSLVAAVTEREAEYPGEGRLHATLRHMHPSKAKKIIREIASIEYSLAHVYYHAED
jgi:hypothetical protein